LGEFHSSSRETVRVLAALSDENRFRIVELLASEAEELSCGAIGKALELSPSLLSHHLSILAEARIIARRKNGLWTMNVLQRSVIEEQVETLQALIRNGDGKGTDGSVLRLASSDEASSSRPGPPLHGDPSDEAIAGS
jgi:DNA-binding transcriptional ArsR family regulator